MVSYFIASTPVAGEPTTSPALLSEALVKAVFYAAIATLIVAPLALTGRVEDVRGERSDGVSWYSRMLGSRPMVFLGEISYEIFLIHLIIMELVMVEILRTPVYTGSMTALFLGTLVVTVPPAWLLHRVTRVRDR